MQCSQCGFDNHAQAQACGKCNRPLNSQTCSNGHPVNPSWDKCPYCNEPLAGGRAGNAGMVVEGSGRIGGNINSATVIEGGAGVGRSTVIEGTTGSFGGGAATFVEGAGSSKRRTMIEGAPAGHSFGGGKGATHVEPAYVSKKARTMIMQPDEGPAADGRVSSTPKTVQTKLVGWLVSFSHELSGKDYRLREGRNILGSSPSGDIIVQEDPEISGHHCTLMWRAGNLFIKDEMSMNGTFVNGADVIDKMVQLNNDDSVVLGKTAFKVKIL